MTRKAFLLLFLLGCSSPAETAPRAVYRVLVATVIDAATGEVTPGWRATVDHHLAGYSGPALAEHFCQPYDDITGEFRIAVAPASLGGKGPFERLGINIENNRADSRYYRTSFYISSEMWQNGRWTEPECTKCWYEDENGRRGSFRPKYQLRLREQ
jgi:hypothetical protein